MSGEDERPQVRCTPTDPSLEFDLFELVRVRLARALERRGRGEIEAERAALYVVEGLRPMNRFMKVMTSPSQPTDEEMAAALGSLLEEAGALGQAKAVLAGARAEGEG